MTDAQSGIGAELGKKAIRFSVTMVGLLLLRALLGELPMLKNAAAIGSTFPSPLVVADAVVDMLVLIAVGGFGLALSRGLRARSPRVPDLSTAALLAFLLIDLVVSYNLYELPVACAVISQQDLFTTKQTNVLAGLGDSGVKSPMESPEMYLRAFMGLGWKPTRRRL